MMQFVFRFLFARNWHTGQLELSRPRVTLFAAMFFLILLGLMMVSILQSPVMYEVM